MAIHHPPTEYALLQRFEYGLLDRSIKACGHLAHLHLQCEAVARTIRSWLDPQSDSGDKGVWYLEDGLKSVPDTCQPFHADNRAVLKFGLDAKPRQQFRLDDLLLHLAIERYENLVRLVVPS
ncbi:hypothetical protein D3C78_1086080 [compost metagenome]